jgi:MSHA biogenesis protein MshQ
MTRVSRAITGERPERHRSPRDRRAPGLARAAPRLPALAPLLLAVTAAACGFKSPDTNTPDGDPQASWLEPWTHRKSITLHASRIEAPGDGALADFPVLVSVTDPQLAAPALAAGSDIVFTAADGTTRLASEIESFSQATGELAAWVKVPSLSATADTTLYVYYGNPTPPAQAPEDTWTAAYLGVWHLGQDPGSGTTNNMLDATRASRHGTSRNMQAANSVSGRIGRGLIFDGSNEFMDFPSLNVGDAFTISMWINLAAVSDVRTLIANSDSGLDADGFRFFVNTAGMSNRKLSFETGNDNGGSGATAATADGAVPTGTFAHVAAVVNRAGQATLLYVNGARVNTSTSTAPSFANNEDLDAGRMKNGDHYFAGTLDQIEIASVLRPAEWLATQVNNQSQPDTFHTLGSEELAP